MEVDSTAQETNVRTLLVSDVHLGCRYAQAERFLSYLNRIRPEQLYILGDFFDGWKLRTRLRWKPIYSRIINRLLDLAESGTELYYTPGNHDAFLRCPQILRLIRSSGVSVHVRDEFVFETLDGRRFLLLHGDRFDIVEMQHQWLSHLLTYVYEPLLSMNWWVNRLRPRDRNPYAGCAVIKGKVKTAVRFLSHFEAELFQYVRDRGCNGVICGHVHTPGIAVTSSMAYINTGDWVENCTALVEHYDGRIVLESCFPERFPTQVYSAGSAFRRHAETCRAEEAAYFGLATTTTGAAEC